MGRFAPRFRVVEGMREVRFPGEAALCQVTGRRCVLDGVEGPS